ERGDHRDDGSLRDLGRRSLVDLPARAGGPARRPARAPRAERRLICEPQPKARRAHLKEKLPVATPRGWSRPNSNEKLPVSAGTIPNTPPVYMQMPNTRTSRS